MLLSEHSLAGGEVEHLEWLTPTLDCQRQTTNRLHDLVVQRNPVGLLIYTMMFYFQDYAEIPTLHSNWYSVNICQKR